MMKSFAVVAALLGVAQASFQDTITPEQIYLMFSDWGLSYQGISNLPAAQRIHADIVSAIAMSPTYSGFCNSADPDANKREAASFFATVRKETGGMSAFEEQVTDPNLYCTSSSNSGASPELQEAGKKYPCAPGNKGYHGRGAIQLTWNINYGRFSEFMYGDKNVLLNNPEKVIGAGPLGWASTLWFWMTPQDYGGQCPPKQHTSYLQTGTESCHNAIMSGQGMGKTINIINGGYECCPITAYRSSAVYRYQSYMIFLDILGAKKAHADCADGNFNYCEMSEGCPVVNERAYDGFPLMGTCTSKLTTRWLSGGPVEVTDYLCAMRDPNPGGEATTQPPLTTVGPPTTTAPVPTTTVAPPPVTTTPGGGGGGGGGCISLQGHISDEWCIANGCEASFPTICQAV